CHLSEPEVARIVTLVEEGYNYRAVSDRIPGIRWIQSTSGARSPSCDYSSG
ncbi:hypothetical protein ILUMI_03808, partial [Ignelater luminosus]